MTDVNYSYYGNNFTTYVSQIIMLYTLNVYSAMRQAYLSKTGKSRWNSMCKERAKLVQQIANNSV